MSISEPGKLITPWAEAGLKNEIPQAASSVTGRAGFDQGFPAINMTPKEEGGIPPFGQDFNGIFYEVTKILQYMQAGGQPTFDAALATAIGGYPLGAVLIGDDGVSFFKNAVAGNETNPNTGGDGWARPDLQMMELYRRSYAEAGYNIVGTFQAGFTLSTANDVGIDLATGKGYTGPAGTVVAGTNPASGGFVDRSNQLSPFVTIKNYGAKADGVSDDTQSVRDMVEDLGYFTLPPGNTVISDSILIPDSPVALGAKWSGAGIERSKIICVGMTGKSALVTKNPNAYYRLTMSDFSISGDCDSCIDMNITDGSNFQLHQSEFRNLTLSSVGGSAFKANRHFSTAWYNVHTSSNNGHGFDIQGGNSTVLVNCYAHRSGSGKAGYRIRGKAVLVGCNGVDAGDVWGDFGATVAADGVNYTYNITIIGGNIEDFNNNAITLRYTGRLSFDGTAFVAKASGTYETLIKGDVYGAGDSSITDINTTFVTKGAVMTAQSKIVHSSGMKLVESTRGVFTDVFNPATGYLIATPVKEGAIVAADKMAIKYGNITWDRGYGFMLQQSNTIASGTTSPSVLRKNLITTANTSPTTIQYLVDGELGQRVTLLIRDSNTILQNQAPGANRLKLKTGANITAVNGDVYEFVSNNGIWVQL